MMVYIVQQQYIFIRNLGKLLLHKKIYLICLTRFMVTVDSNDDLNAKGLDGDNADSDDDRKNQADSAHTAMIEEAKEIFSLFDKVKISR